MTLMDIYIGTYTQKESKGIYRVSFNNGFFSKPELFCEIENPKYLYRYKDKIVTIYDKDNQGGIALIDNGNIISNNLYEDVSSCYVTGKDNDIYTANYHEGTFSKLHITDNKIDFLKTISVEKGCGCHQIMFLDNTILVPCLFLDMIKIYDKNLEQHNEIAFPEKSGPRHGIFTSNNRYLYVLCELNCHVYKIDTKTFSIIKDIPLLDEDVDGGGAIRIKDNHIYCSIRSKNLISVVSMDDDTVIQNVSCYGDHPRDFIIVDDYLLCANRFSNNLISMKILDDGTLTEKTDEVTIPEAVALII